MDILAFEGRSPEIIERVIVVAAEVLASGLQLERGNVFVNYREALSGRVYTGGEVVKKDDYRRDPS